MDKISVFSKTGKGLLQIKCKSHQLPEMQFRVLRLIDGKTMVGNLAHKSPVSEADLYNALRALTESGFIREATTPLALADLRNTTTAFERESDTDLDFTNRGGLPKAPKRDGS